MCCSQLVPFWDVLVSQLLDFNSDLFSERMCLTSPYLPLSPIQTDHLVEYLNLISTFTMLKEGLVISLPLLEQLSDFMKGRLWHILCGFKKQHSTLHVLPHMIENGGSGAIVGVLMDLSKTYGRIPR